MLSGCAEVCASQAAAHLLSIMRDSEATLLRGWSGAGVLDDDVHHEVRRLHFLWSLADHCADLCPLLPA